MDGNDHRLVYVTIKVEDELNGGSIWRRRAVQWMILTHYSQWKSHPTTLQTTSDRWGHAAIFQRGTIIICLLYGLFANYSTPVSIATFNQCHISAPKANGESAFYLSPYHRYPKFMTIICYRHTQCWIAAIWSDMSLVPTEASILVHQSLQIEDI